MYKGIKKNKDFYATYQRKMSCLNAINFQSISDKVHFQSKLQLHNNLDILPLGAHKLEIAGMQEYAFKEPLIYH